MDEPKLLTLTWKSRLTLDRQFIQDAKNHLKKLFRRHPFNQNRGGLYSFEVTQGERGYHLHVHLIIDIPYIWIGTWKKHWFDITQDSYIIDIQPIFSKKWALNYVLKYVVKPSQGNIPSHIINSAFKGFRLVQPFGFFYNYKKPPKGKLICEKCQHHDAWVIADSFWLMVHDHERKCGGITTDWNNYLEDIPPPEDKSPEQLQEDSLLWVMMQ